MIRNIRPVSHTVLALALAASAPAYAQDVGATGTPDTPTEQSQDPGTSTNTDSEEAPEEATDGGIEDTSGETGEEAGEAETEAPDAEPAEAEDTDGTDTESGADDAAASGDEATSDTDAEATEGSDAVIEGEGASAERTRMDIPLVPESAIWDGFHGQGNAQKYSPLTQITADNVGELEKVWEVHTGDVSDGSGDLPATVWSATPVYANGMLYIGTPFYRVLALDPATGEEIWSFDTESTLEALTQPALKNRGVSYWEADEPVEGEACQKIVYLGTMDAQLFAMDADTGELCEDFAEGGVLDVNQWNDTNDRWPLSLLQPPTVARDKLIIGWAGKDWEWAAAPPGSVLTSHFRLCHGP